MHEVAVDSYCEQNSHNYRTHYFISRNAEYNNVFDNCDYFVRNKKYEVHHALV